MNDLPAWALERARYIIADSIILNTNTKMEIQRGDMDDIFRELLPFARALVAERERAAAIAQNKITRAEKAYLGMCDCGNCDLQMVEDFIAAAIRKGE